MGQRITHIAGNALTTTYRAYIDDGQGYGLRPSAAMTVPRSGLRPKFGAMAYPEWRFPLHIIICSGGDTERKNLAHWMNPGTETPWVLTATDADGTSNPRYINVMCESLQPVRGRNGIPDLWHFVAMCVTDGDCYWRKVTADTQEWLVTSDGDTEVVANGGEDDAYLKLTITPTAVKTADWHKRSFVIINWKALYPTVRAYPFRIGPWDTASLVKTATATTLDGAINDAVTTISLTDASGFASSGMAYITDAVNGDEQISYTGKSTNDLTGVTRGIGGTTAVAHADLDAIAQSHIQADGRDLRIYVDGSEIDYWYVDFDNANTYIWINTNWAAQQSGTLVGAMTDVATVTTITLYEDISGFPSSGMLLIDSEVFTYTGKNTTDKQFTGVTRAAKDTTAAAHTDTDAVYWIQHDIWLFYSHDSAAAPTIDADYQPILKTTSTNASWIYESFGEDDGKRTGCWYTGFEAGSAGGSVDYYTASQHTDADPWEEIGVGIQSAGAGVSSVAWYEIYNPCYITNANFTNGEKYAVIKTSYYGSVGSGSIYTGSCHGNTEYDIPDPAANTTWEAWSNDTAITALCPYVGLLIAAGWYGWDYAEAADVTLTLNGTYAPAHEIIAETANGYTLACTITNNTTVEAISLAFPGMDLTESLEVDTTAETLTYLKDDTLQMQALTVVSGPRRHWLRIQPGNNTLQYDETGVLGVTVDLTWAERHYS